MDKSERDKNAVVLLSGGIDSTTTMAIARSQGYNLYALSFRYGQKNTIEIDSAKNIASAFGAKEHLVLDIDLRTIGGSALTDQIPVPKGRSNEEISKGIPVTYVPARNTIFLSSALAVAETRGASNIFIGVNAIDFSGYPDCRAKYIQAFEDMANLATKAGTEEKIRIKIRTPLIQMTKAEIIRKGYELGVDYGLTISCYDPMPDGAPCGMCDSCLIKAKGFEEAGLYDPVSKTV